MSMHSHVVASVSGQVVYSLSDSVINAVSGAFAGLVSSFCVAPLDVVKTRLQAQKRFSVAAIPPQNGKQQIPYRGILGMMICVV